MAFENKFSRPSRKRVKHWGKLNYVYYRNNYLKIKEESTYNHVVWQYNSKTFRKKKKRIWNYNDVAEAGRTQHRHAASFPFNFALAHSPPPPSPPP